MQRILTYGKHQMSQQETTSTANHNAITINHITVVY